MADLVKLALTMDTSRLDAKLAAYVVAAQEAVEKAQAQNAEDMQAVAHAEIETTSRSGRVYEKHGITREASGPGDAPAEFTGALLQNVKGYVLERFTAILVASSKYAVPLEFGTRKMEKRPFMYHARNIVWPRARKRIRAAVNSIAKVIAAGGG